MENNPNIENSYEIDSDEWPVEALDAESSKGYCFLTQNEDQKCIFCRW